MEVAFGLVCSERLGLIANFTGNVTKEQHIFYDSQSRATCSLYQCRIWQTKVPERGATGRLVPLSIPAGILFVCLALLFPAFRAVLVVRLPNRTQAVAAWRGAPWLRLHGEGGAWSPAVGSIFSFTQSFLGLQSS